MNERSIHRAVAVLILLLAVFPVTAAATTTAQYWEEIGGSATGAGISASELGVVPEHRNASIVIDADGRPVVAADPGLPEAQALTRIAQNIADRVALANMTAVPRGQKPLVQLGRKA